LQELAKQHRFQPFEQAATFKVLVSIKEVIGTSMLVVLSTKEELL